MKIVIDTNLLIDGSADDYNFGHRIINEVLAGKINAYANRATLAENRLIARRKITDPDYLSKLNDFFDSIILIDSKGRLDIVEDPDDNKILESAVDSDSQYLITSDHHLLKLGMYEQVQIVTPSGFWQAYEESTGSGWQNWISDFINR